MLAEQALGTAVGREFAVIVEGQGGSFMFSNEPIHHPVHAGQCWAGQKHCRPGRESKGDSGPVKTKGDKGKTNTVR